MQIITRHVETGELGQQVSHTLPGEHMTVGKNRIRSFLTQLSLFILDLFIDSRALSEKTSIFLHEMHQTALM